MTTPALNDVPVFSFEIDWANGYTETLEWKTAVNVSPVGAEQRYAARVTPRRKFDLPYVLTGAERAYYDQQLMHFGGRSWFIPLPHEGVFLRGPIAAGTSAFNFDTTFREFIQGRQVILRGKNPWDWDVLQIEAITDTGITTSTTPVLDYPDGCMIYPAVYAYITDATSQSRPTARALTGTIQFTALESTIWPINGRSDETMPYLDSGNLLWPVLRVPVLNIEPNSRDALDYGYERVWRTIDNQVALPVIDDPSGRAFTTQTYNWFLTGRQARSNFRDLIFRLCGQRGAVWVPTFNDDLEPGATYYPNPHQRMSMQEGRTMAMTFYRNGTTSIAPILANPDGSVSVPQVFDSALILRVSFIELKRLNTDTVEIVHQADVNGTATVTIVLRDAPDIRVVADVTVPGYTDVIQLQPDGSGVIPVNTPPVGLGGPVTITGAAGGTP